MARAVGYAIYIVDSTREVCLGCGRRVNFVTNQCQLHGSWISISMLPKYEYSCWTPRGNSLCFFKFLYRELYLFLSQQRRRTSSTRWSLVETIPVTCMIHMALTVFKNISITTQALGIWIQNTKAKLNCFSLGSSSQNLTIASHLNPRKLELHVSNTRASSLLGTHKAINCSRM